MRRNVLIALAVVALVVVTAYVLIAFSGLQLFGGSGATSDEAPIRVKNGSMEIIPGMGGEWQKDGDEFAYHDSNSPKGHRGRFSVRVNTSHGVSCVFRDAKTVSISYLKTGNSVPFTAMFRSRGLFVHHTAVPAADLTLGSDRHLTYGAHNDGAITLVTTDRGDSCAIGSDLVDVVLCSAPGGSCAR